MNERGSGLVLSLIVLAVLGLLSSAISYTVQALQRASVYELRLAQAQAFAEAGVEDARRELARDPGWRGGFQKKAFAGGAYTVTVSSSSPPVIESTGYAASAEKTVRVTAGS